MLYFDVIVRQVMTLSLERIIWYDFNGFLHVDFFVEEPFFPAKKLLDEPYEEVLSIYASCSGIGRNTKEANSYI